MHFDVDSHMIALLVSGSHAYGMGTETSDLDLRGACIPPRRVRESYYLRFEQWQAQVQTGAWGDRSAQGLRALHGTALASYERDGQTADVTIYALTKLVGLAANANPNVLELLFVDEDDVLFASSAWRVLLANRDLFLSQKCRHTYAGYAHAQLRKIKSHREWLRSALKEPTRAEFGLPESSVLPADVRGQIDEAVTKTIRQWGVDEGLDDVLTGAALDVLRERMLDFQAAALGVDHEALDGALYETACSAIGIPSDVLAVVKAERLYRAARKHWGQYLQWQRNRNPARAEMEARFGFDCYADDTLFLTDGGWKRFDDIGDTDKLATMCLCDLAHRPFGRVEYQAPIERFSGSFTGNMYKFTGHHTDVLVTPNHRMLYREVSRKKGETYGVALGEASVMPDSFDFVRTVTPWKTRYCMRSAFDGVTIKREVYLRVMGWYLSDGCARFKRGVLDSIAVSQKRGGRLHREMSRLHNRYGTALRSGLYCYNKQGIGGRIDEVVLLVKDKAVVERLVADCGAKKSKRIPRWVFGLSKHLMETLFDAMCGGDGTVRKTSKRSWIYYTTLPGLADDVNELALLCGWETSVWGPYRHATELNPDGLMYHVHVDKNAEQYQRFNRRTNISTEYVVNQRIVCFTVPNGTLITRRHGRVGIHGNSKHGAHLLRLARTGVEVVRDGVLRVRRPDADELLAARQGAIPFDNLVAEAEALENQMRDALVSSPLPKTPPAEKIDAVLLKILEAFDGRLP